MLAWCAVMMFTAMDARGAEPLKVEVNIAKAPGLEDWGRQAGELVGAQIGGIEKFLAGEGYTRPGKVTLVFDDEMKGVAHTAGDTIVISGKWVREHPEDWGMVVHELVHVVQQYRRGERPGWLVEGIADYARYYRYEPGSPRGRFDPDRSDYRRGYQPTAGLLDYVSRTYDPLAVPKLNDALRRGAYTGELIHTITGKDFDALWSEFKASRKG
jgi:hypothetical protein